MNVGMNETMNEWMNRQWDKYKVQVFATFYCMARALNTQHYGINGASR